MKPKIGAVAMLLGALVWPVAGHPADVSWTLPTAYTNGTPITPADVGQIVVKVYTAPSSGGQWTLAATAPPGGTSVTAPDPGPGEILWYAITSTLNGVESTYSAPVSKTTPAGQPPAAPKVPGSPTNLRISLLPFGPVPTGWWFG